jgi:hypothetical protein
VNDKVNKLRFGQVNLFETSNEKEMGCLLHGLIIKLISTGTSIDKEKNTILHQYAWFSWWN